MTAPPQNLLMKARAGLETFVFFGLPSVMLVANRGGYDRASDRLIDWTTLTLMIAFLITSLDQIALLRPSGIPKYRWLPHDGAARWATAILGVMATLPLVGCAALSWFTRLDPRWIYQFPFAAAALASLALLIARFWVRHVHSEANPASRRR